jgi:V8-like Glu-specific endopeptidase
MDVTNHGGTTPYVGLMVADVAGDPQWRCTGTLISPTVFLTAGHCTYGADDVTIWFESEVKRGDPAFGYPDGGPTSVEGTPYTHPAYDPDAFYLYDLGVVVLDEPMDVGTYGALPDEGFFDELFTRRGLSKQRFTPVGYGLQFTNPAKTVQELIRYRADVQIITGDNLFGGGSVFDTDDESVLFTNNAKTGGTCFGDSGGPIFVGDTNVVAAVTSFGIN